MSRFIRILWLVLVLVLAGLAGCNLGGGATPATPDPNTLYTEIWLTAAAGQTETAMVAPLVPTATLAPQASPTLEPSNTPLISDTPEGGDPTSTSLVFSTRPPSQQPCDNAEFIADVTYPDGTEVTPNTVITKTWRFKNLGPCSWDKDYHLIFGWLGEGTDWGTVDWTILEPVPFNKVIQPGETLDISVKLKIPIVEGGYGATFRLQNDKGFNFGEPFSVWVRAVKP